MAAADRPDGFASEPQQDPPPSSRPHGSGFSSAIRNSIVLRILTARRTTHTPLAYAVAIAATAAALAVRWAMDPLLGHAEPFPTLYGAVALAAWYGGYGPAVLTTGLGYVVANYFFIEPRGAFGFPGAAEFLGLPLYLMSCLIITGFAEAMRAAHGRYESAASDARDRQKALEHEVAERKQSEERLRLALDAGRMATWDWNIPTDELGSPAFGEARRGEAPGPADGTFDDVLNLIHPDDRERALLAIASAVARRTEYESEFRTRWPDGSTRWLLRKGKILPDERGRPARMIGVSLDITERKQAEEAIKEADRRKDEFLAILSHELRSPLNVVLLWVRLLRAGVIDAATVQQALEIIEENAVLQNRLIADLLDVSRIMAGKLILDMRTVDLARIVELAVNSHRPLAAAKCITLNVYTDQDVGPVTGDPARLGQVIGNLLSNAVQFTPEGGRIDVTLLQAGDSARIIVTDTGKGIAPEFLPRLFERFQQDAGGRAHAGLGLGLFMVRHLVELHGGRVSARSAGENRGATFTVDLPLAEGDGSSTGSPAAASKASSVDSATLAGMHVLVVDDDAKTVEVLTAVLRRHGAEVTGVPSAHDAREVLQLSRPDVLLCDIAMPDEDGLTFIADLRASEVTSQRAIPAVALTASASGQDRDRALLAGFDCYLSKPVEADELCAAIAAVCPRRASQGGAG